MGGANDNYLNPELLFAAGFSACFLSALNRVINQEKIKTGEATVTAQVNWENSTNPGMAWQWTLK